VESSAIYFRLKEKIDMEEAKEFIDIIKKAFSEKRKKLSSNLCKHGLFQKAEIDAIFE
jgi:16S rRNA A1518/A1519 N6-dimethyltransferase RsmA/KsgA/DIM1 with predicted DNA glycosylase/AP lyase activity